MLHIVWLLFKIIGMIIIALVLLILAIILIVLFVPVRYKALLSHGEEIYLNSKIHWFLSIISIAVSYENNIFSIKFKIFGKLIFDNQKENNKKTKKVRKKKIKVKKKTKDKNHDVKEVANIKTNIEEKDNKLFNKFKKIYETIINTPNLIKEKIQKLINKMINSIKNIYKKFINLFPKINKLKEFIDDETNKKAIKLIIIKLKRILKHIKPKRIKSCTTFGAEDPSTTGQILGVLSALGIGLKNDIRIMPDFENSIFEGNHYISGRIRIFFLLIIIIRLITNKDFKKMQTNFNNLKEAL